MNDGKPWLSIVIAARNDDYGGDFNQRLENSLHWWEAWAKTFQISIEFLLVNYNPPPDKAHLNEIIHWPLLSKNITIRIVEVSSEIHLEYLNPQIRKTVPLFEFIAKNIGIRRAKGEYILCTNADILPDPGIFVRLRMKKFAKGFYYRANRADFKKQIVFDFLNPLKVLLEIRKGVFKIFLKGYSYEISPGSFSVFGMFSRRIKNSVKIWKDFQLLKFEDLANKYSIPILYENLAQKYHLHASGDFMLMHRDHWFDLRGYPENCYAAVHTDSLFTVQAACSGLKEKILSAPVYHQDHNRPDSHHFKENEDFKRMYQRLVTEGRRMDTEKKSILYNDENWGAGIRNFQETTIHSPQ